MKIPDHIKEYELRIDPNNQYLTIPRSYGVFELPDEASGKTYRFGNYPIRMIELEREFGDVHLVCIYLDREKAKEHTRELNRLNKV